jgi:hypothetical protein
METAKEEVRRILDSLPDDATLEGIQYRITFGKRSPRGCATLTRGKSSAKKR